MSAIIEINYDAPPCKICGGVKIYRKSRNCVKCRRTLINAKIRAKCLQQREALAATVISFCINGRSRPFTIEEARSEAFKEAERIVMADVRYENMGRITL